MNYPRVNGPDPADIARVAATVQTTLATACGDQHVSVDRMGSSAIDGIAGSGAHGGSSFWMRAPDGVDTGQLAQDLRAQGV